MLRLGRLAPVAAVLLILTNGPVFLLAKEVLGRPGHWEDPAVWPFFVGAAVASAMLAGAAWRKRSAAPAPEARARALGSVEGCTVRDSSVAADARMDLWQRVAAVSAIWFGSAALASTLWSVDPAATSWRAGVYLGLALLAWVISQMELDDILSLLMLVAATAVVSSLAVVTLWPEAGLDHNGAWRGVYTNRNSLAPLAAIAVLVSLRRLAEPCERRRFADAFTLKRRQRATDRVRPRRHRGAHSATSGAEAHRRVRATSRAAPAVLAVLSLSTMMGAGSRTAWLALAVACTAATLPLASHTARDRWGARAGRSCASAGALAFARATAVTLAALWDTPTFAQRREMWGLVLERVAERPILGHGFFTFWDIEELTIHPLLRRGSAHNSLMEVALGLGLLGTIPFLVLVALAARNAALGVWRHPSAGSWAWAAVVALVLVENVAESFVLWFSYSWVLIMAAAMRPTPRARAAHAASLAPTPTSLP